MASLIKLLKEDRRRKKMSSDKVKMEDTLRDIQENPAKFAMASSLTDDRSWLHFAAQQASIPAVKALIENGADVNARDLVERTPLHHGAFTSTKEGGEVVKLLLEAGAEPNAVDCMGYTPLHFACQMENYHAINVLARSKADVNAKGPSGFAPLHIVSQSETSILCVDALLRAGASVNVYDEANRSPVDIARERGAYKALKALHDAAGKRGRVKYLFRDEARDLGSSLAREGAPLRQAIPQMLMAVASGLDPRTGDYWAEKPDYRNEAEEKQKEDLLDAKKKMPGAKNWGRLATRKRGKVLEGKFVESMLVALPGPKSKFDLAAKDAAAERKIEEEDAAIAAAEAAKGGAAAHDESFYSQAHAYDAAQSFYGATSMDPANPTVSATWAQSEYNAQEWNTGDAAGGAGAAAAAGGWEGSGYADASGYGQVGDSSGYGDASASGYDASGYGAAAAADSGAYPEGYTQEGYTQDYSGAGGSGAA